MEKPSVIICAALTHFPAPRSMAGVVYRVSFLLLVLAILAPLRGQDQPVHMNPEFALTFPLASNGKDVTVKFPILINPSTVLKPGMVLRTLYVLTYDSGGNTDLVLAHHGDMEQSYSRAAPETDGQTKLPPELAHEIEGYRRTVWEVPNNFILAMAQYPTDTMHLIYSTTGKNSDLDDERFSFFDGLMVGLPGGKVTVLAVEKGSKAEAAGIQPGDEIVAVGGRPTQHDLATFAADYSEAKKVAKDDEVSTYAMDIRTGGGSARTVNIALPPKIKSSLMDGFDQGH